MKIVATYMDAPISDQQRKILQSLIENTEAYHINGLDITLAIHQGKTFIPDSTCWLIVSSTWKTAMLFLSSLKCKKRYT